MITLPNIIEDQFMYSAVVGVVKGQKAKNHKGVKKHSAAMLMGRPNLPSDHLRGGNSGPLSRR